jgi:diadenosine tetraphosphate (Ap4A) HIT family hydrolase
MVIPRKHGKSVLDFTAAELGYLWETVKRVEKALIKTYNTESFSVGINQGEKAGVEHLHIHIMPRFPGDNGRIIQDLVKKESKTVLSKVIKKITINIE